MTEKKVEREIQLPEGFSAEITQNTITINGNGKQATRKIKAKGIELKKQDSHITVIGKPATRKMNALASTISSHINNMVQGLQTEYAYRLTIVYSHFPMNLAIKGNHVEINNFTGEKKARTAKIVPGTTVTVKGKEITVKSPYKEAAGQTAANIEQATKVKGKDKRIYQDGIFITEKAEQEKVNA